MDQKSNSSDQNIEKSSQNVDPVKKDTIDDLREEKSSKTEENNNLELDAIEALVEKLDNLTPMDKCESDEQKKKKENKDESRINYFEKKTIHAKPSTSTKDQKIDMERYKQVKEKILNKNKSQEENRQTKLMSVDECVKLLKEHEKKVQVRDVSIVNSHKIVFKFN